MGGANEIFGDHLPLNLFPAVATQCVGLQAELACSWQERVKGKKGSWGRVVLAECFFA